MTTIEILFVIVCAGWGFCGGLAIARARRLRAAESRAEAAELAATYHRGHSAKLAAQVDGLVDVISDQHADLEDALDAARETSTRLNRRAQRAESETAKLRREAVGLWRVIAYWRSEAKRLGRDREQQPEVRS